MTTLTIENDIKLKKTNFTSLIELYDFMIDNQLITEVGVINESDLNEKSKKLLEKSKTSSKLINI